MTDIAGSKSHNELQKNRRFWIADLLKLFDVSEQPSNGTENGSKIQNAGNNISSRIKTLSVVGVIVDLRNEKNDCLSNNSSTEGSQRNRPIVYGKRNYH